MKFKYVMTRNEFKKTIIRNNSKLDYLILLLASTYFIIRGFFLPFIVYGWFYVAYVVFLAISWLIMMGINELYARYLLKLNDKATNNAYGEHLVNVDDEKIEEEVNGNIYKILWEDIKKVSYHKDNIVILPKPNNKKSLTTGFVYYQEYFSNKKDFDHLVEFVEKKFPHKK